MTRAYVVASARRNRIVGIVTRVGIDTLRMRLNRARIAYNESLLQSSITLWVDMKGA